MVDKVKWSITDSLKKPVGIEQFTLDSKEPLKCLFKPVKPGYYVIQLDCEVGGQSVSSSVGCDFSALPVTKVTKLDVTGIPTFTFKLDPLTKESILAIEGIKTDKLSLSLAGADSNFDGSRVIAVNKSESLIAVTGTFVNAESVSLEPHSVYRFISIGKGTNEWIVERVGGNGIESIEIEPVVSEPPVSEPDVPVVKESLNG